MTDAIPSAAAPPGGVTNRFGAWMGLMAFSAISLGAFVGASDSDSRGAKDNWVISCTAISMSFAFFAVVAHFVAHDKFVCKPVEGGVATLLIAIWCGGLPVIMKPENGFAVSGRVINNANLYFFSWGAFIANIYICASFVQETKLADLESAAKSLSPKMVDWYMLCTASIVVLAASINSWDTFKCSDGSELCKRTAFAMSVGAIGTFFALVVAMASIRMTVPLLVETLMAIILLGVYCFGVAFITSGKGPGSSVGNLYFSTWIGFLVSIKLFAKCIKDFLASRKSGDGDKSAEVNDKA